MKNSKSCFGHDNIDVLIWHLNEDTENVVGHKVLEFRLEVLILESLAYKGNLKSQVYVRLPL